MIDPINNQFSSNPIQSTQNNKQTIDPIDLQTIELNNALNELNNISISELTSHNPNPQKIPESVISDIQNVMSKMKNGVSTVQQDIENAQSWFLKLSPEQQMAIINEISLEIQMLKITDPNIGNYIKKMQNFFQQEIEPMIQSIEAKINTVRP